MLDLDSKEERGGTSLANSAEAQLAVHLYQRLKAATNGLSALNRVAVITPYAQQARMLRSSFTDALGDHYQNFVEVNTVDAFQGREANIVIFSCVRAAGSRGIGFLSDVRRMNVALTRAKHFLFIIARCKSIVVNPYWRDLVAHARASDAVLTVPMKGGRKKRGTSFTFPDLTELRASKKLEPTPGAPASKPKDPRKGKDLEPAVGNSALRASDPRRMQTKSPPPTESPQSVSPPRPKDPRRIQEIEPPLASLSVPPPPPPRGGVAAIPPPPPPRRAPPKQPKDPRRLDPRGIPAFQPSDPRKARKKPSKSKDPRRRGYQR